MSFAARTSLALLALLVLLALSAPLESSASVEAGPCSRIDHRTKLREIGWPRAVHLGARSSALPIALAEAVSFKLGSSITALELDRVLAKGETPERAVASLAKIGACPLGEGPIDDRVVTRAPIGCDTHPERRLKPATLTLAKISLASHADLDASLDAGRVPVVQWETPTGILDSTLEARRFSPAKERCEWLVRMMNGPFCDPSLEGTCEDGGIWIARDEMMKRLKSAQEIR